MCVNCFRRCKTTRVNRRCPHVIPPRIQPLYSCLVIPNNNNKNNNNNNGIRVQLQRQTFLALGRTGDGGAKFIGDITLITRRGNISNKPRYRSSWYLNNVYCWKQKKDAPVNDLSLLNSRSYDTSLHRQMYSLENYGLSLGRVGVLGNETDGYLRE